MQKTAIIVIMVGNCVAAGYCGFQWCHSTWVVSMSAPARVTDLDRAGIINATNLAAWSPQLATNLRYNLGMWVAREEREAAIHNAQMGLVFSLANVLALGLLSGWIVMARRRSLRRLEKASAQERPLDRSQAE